VRWSRNYIIEARGELNGEFTGRTGPEMGDADSEGGKTLRWLRADDLRTCARQRQVTRETASRCHQRQPLISGPTSPPAIDNAEDDEGNGIMGRRGGQRRS